MTEFSTDFPQGEPEVSNEALEAFRRELDALAPVEEGPPLETAPEWMLMRANLLLPAGAQLCGILSRHGRFTISYTMPPSDELLHLDEPASSQLALTEPPGGRP